MSPLRLFKRNRLLSFVAGFLIFAIFIPGCFSLNRDISQVNSNLSQVNSKSENQITLAKGNNLPNSVSPLGVNLNGIADWSTQFPFLDVFKSARKWITQTESEWDTNEYNLLELDANGWVKSLPSPGGSAKYTRVRTIVNVTQHAPGGKYVVLYDGEGTIEYQFKVQKDEAASKLGRDVINVTPSDEGIHLIITSTDPKRTGNYIRNIRVIQAENEKLYQSGEIFNPVFIEKINKFKTLRFMDWIATNFSEQKDWSSRPKQTDYSWSIKGCPLEVMVALANKLKADPWFNMPHMANEEYITQFAQYVKEKLNPTLTAYVEFSNEVWNFSFEQAQFALKQGKARWGQDKGDAHIQWLGMQGAKTCDIWKKQVFGESQKNRVNCVLATQTGWKGLEDPLLDCPLWVAEGNAPCYQHGIDSYAITGYFHAGLGVPENTNTVLSWRNDADGGFAKAFEQIKTGKLLKADDSIADFKSIFDYHANVARKKNLKLVTYEGGSHIVGIGDAQNNDQLTEFLIAINRHPEMHKVYLDLLNIWKQAGGTLFTHFSDIGIPSKYGSWGALEYVSQNGSPKYNALIQFIDKNPCWWEGCAKNSAQRPSRENASLISPNKISWSAKLEPGKGES